MPPGPYTMDELVDDAARLIREWGRGPVVFVGLSMGGMVGQGLAIRHPELREGLGARQHDGAVSRGGARGVGAAHRAVEQGGMAAVADMVVERYLHAGFRARIPTRRRPCGERCCAAIRPAMSASCHAVAGVDWLDRLPRSRAARRS